MDGRSNWATPQLVEFLAGVSASIDEASAAAGAVERAAEALEAEVGALVVDGDVVAAVGFPTAAVPTAALLAAIRGNSSTVDLPGIGVLNVAAMPVEEEPESHLLVARADGAFEAEELVLVRGMARTLGLTFDNLRHLEAERSLREQSERQAQANARLLASLHKRQRLLERSSVIQRLISHRAPLDAVLDAIVEGARELLGDEVVALRMLDPEDVQAIRIVASRGIGEELLNAMRRSRLGEGAGGIAIAEGRLVVIENYASAPDAMREFAEVDLQSALGAPVHENGHVVGSLVVASYEHGRTYSASEREVLTAFAEHASLALTDAKTVHEMLHQALHDSLTGLPNRALFLDRLEHAVERSQPGLEPAVLFLDLDRFKTVNDSLGHPTGDRLLLAVAERIQSCIRGHDTAARLGGDEFAILVEDVEPGEQLTRVAQRVVDAMRLPFYLDGKEVVTSASVGAARGRHGAMELMRDADIAMYHAKEKGRGRYELFERSMLRGTIDRLDRESELQRGIERGEFVLQYQPVVQLDTLEIRGVEALVRWRHPERGMLDPGDFIPLAEESGLILPLGRWVLREAWTNASHWRAAHPEGDLSMSVNLSSRQLLQAGLVPYVVHLLDELRLDASRLVLEITESVFMQNADTTVEQLAQLRALGLRLAVDDFGTGYSSLRYLHEFPIDVLKIARTFVEGVATSPQKAALARVIVDLGATLGMQVVAEGIESQEQLDRLRELGTELGQGYLLGHPVDAPDIAQLLNQPCVSLPAAVPAE